MDSEKNTGGYELWWLFGAGSAIAALAVLLQTGGPAGAAVMLNVGTNVGASGAAGAAGAGAAGAASNPCPPGQTYGGTVLPPMPWPHNGLGCPVDPTAPPRADGQPTIDHSGHPTMWPGGPVCYGPGSPWGGGTTPAPTNTPGPSPTSTPSNDSWSPTEWLRNKIDETMDHRNYQ